MNAPQNLPTLYPMSDLERMADAIVGSKLFGLTTREQAITLMLVAQAEGMHPATAARDYHIISNRPAMKADAMLARFQRAGGVVEWHSYTDTKVVGVFSHPQSPRPVTVEWTIEMAKKIGLAGKDNWVKYSRAMLRARVISEGVRTCYPAISTGFYTPEEVSDFTPMERDVTPASNGLPTAPINPTTGALDGITAERQEIIMATAVEIKKAFAEDRVADAYGLYSASGFSTEERIGCWSLLDSKIRSTLKRMHAAEEAAKDDTVSVPAKKRLEALIREHGLNREAVKAYCVKAYSKEHFSELTPAELTELEGTLKALKEEQEAAA